MQISKLVPVISFFLCVIVTAVSLPGHNFHDARLPAYAERGDEVEKQFRGYSERLANHRKQLTQTLSASAPELLVDLEQPERIQQGYQILPSIIEPAPDKNSGHAGVVAYSWPWTTRLLEREKQAFKESEAALRRLASAPPQHQRALLPRLVSDYRARRVQHRNIAAHIGYNRFWQAAIAADRSVYDHQTALQRLVIEQQRIDDRLQRVRATFVTGNDVIRRRGAPIRVSEIEEDLLARRTILTRRIDHATGALDSPGFVRMEKSSAGWIFHVPLFTDIQDRSFVEQIKQIVETTWRFQDRTTGYQIALEITYLPVKLLYISAKPNPGDRLDVQRHLARFPTGGAILTTGGLTTHVRDYAIVLGPYPLTPHAIAHEFGHVLGFRDRYVRGYRNLGKDGFQVMEIVADATDIMAATNQGLVQSKHFSRLAEHYTKKSPELKPVRQELQEKPRLTKS